MSEQLGRPFADDSPVPVLSDAETQILARLRSGEELHIGRHYVDGDYLNSFWWNHDDHQLDIPVWMLIRRGLIYVTGCAGGAQWFEAVSGMGSE